MFCKPPHPPMHPVYIVIFRGDDTDFTGNQEILVKIHTERDISGCKAYFKYMGNVQTFDEIPEDKELHLVFSREQTKDMPLGTWDAELYLIDEQGRRMTVNNRIHMLVTNSVHEAYFPDDPQAVTVVINANEYVKDAEVSQDGKTLTLTKRDGTTVEFRGGGGSGGTDDYNDLENKPSVNGKTLQGDVLLSGNDIPVEDEESMSVTSAINETNVELNVHKDDKDNPHEVTAGQVGTYTASEIDDKINRFSAHYLTYDADGNPFATDTELTSAEQFYYAGELFTPTKNDYCVVLSDSGHDGKTTRYAFVGEWGEGGFWQYQYTINDTAFSQAQWAAINSGATTEKIAEIAEKADEFTEWEYNFFIPPGSDGPAPLTMHIERREVPGGGFTYYYYADNKRYDEFIFGFYDTPYELKVENGFGLSATRRRVLRTGDADKLTDAQKAVLNGGPYLPLSGGMMDDGSTINLNSFGASIGGGHTDGTVYIQAADHTGEPRSGTLQVYARRIMLNNDEVSTKKVFLDIQKIYDTEDFHYEIKLNGATQTFDQILAFVQSRETVIRRINAQYKPIFVSDTELVFDCTGTQADVPASRMIHVKKVGNVVTLSDEIDLAGLDQVNGLAQYPIKAVVGNALLDRTVNTSTGGAFTFPASGTGARDFVVVVAASATAPSVSFPSSGVTYFSDDDAVWTAEADKVNIWYFTEIAANQFMVAHKALAQTAQA